MIENAQVADTATKVGLLLSLAEEIDEAVLKEVIRLSDHPLAKLALPMIEEVLKQETGLTEIPIDKMGDGLKLAAFFVSEVNKLGIRNALKEGKNDGTGK